jgi:mannosyl-3-phosphoglycerate phosphatase
MHHGQIIFSDLDGTFLDESTYSCALSLPALRLALEEGVEVVFCSSKTHGEIQSLLVGLDLVLPFIAENGGGIFIPPGHLSMASDKVPQQDSWHVIALGVPYSVIVNALREVRRSLGVDLRGFSDMSVEEVAAVCQLDRLQAALAKQRLFDEPFLIGEESPDLPGRLEVAFARRNLALVPGGRFFHLTGFSDKGAAIRRFVDLTHAERKRPVTIGIGDSANDVPMLSAVDIPVVVQKSGGVYDEDVTLRLPGILRAPGIGPAGWHAMVMKLLSGELFPQSNAEGQ